MDPQNIDVWFNKEVLLGRTEDGKSISSPEEDVSTFEAVFAIAGLLVVANVLRRRNK